jgi:hypothetical protein
LLKTSLLLWEQLEFIVPWDGYKPEYLDKEFAEAIELIGVHRSPTEEEKRDIHVKLEDFATRKLPESLYYHQAQRSQFIDYEVYPQKLLPDTWMMLRAAQLTSNPLANADYPTTEAAGLSILSMLADTCAGETRARITDRGLAYATITNLLVDEPKPTEVDYESVVPLTLKTGDLSEVSLRKLIDFRKRETGTNGDDFRAMRHQYLERVEKHVKAVGAAKTAGDRAELQRCFEADMNADSKSLLRELGSARTDFVFSKDIVVSVLTGIAVYADLALGMHLAIPTALTFAGLPVAVGGVLGTMNRYGNARRATMQKHPMAYVYELEA